MYFFIFFSYFVFNIFLKIIYDCVYVFSPILFLGTLSERLPRKRTTGNFPTKWTLLWTNRPESDFSSKSFENDLDMVFLFAMDFLGQISGTGRFSLRQLGGGRKFAEGVRKNLPVFQHEAIEKGRVGRLRPHRCGKKSP